MSQSVPAFLFNMLLTAVVVSFAAWLSKTKPGLAGFIVALPITTLLVLPLSHLEFSNPTNSVHFAKSIFVGVPVSLLFFVPFFFAERFQLPFWSCYSLGIALLVAGYFVHKKVVGVF